MKLPLEIRDLALPTVLCDDDLKVIDANRSAAALFEFGDAPLVGVDFVSLISGDGAPDAGPPVTPLSSAQTRLFKCLVRSRFRGTASVSKTQSGWLVQVADVDDMVSERDALARRESTWRHAIEAAGHGVWEFDARTGDRFFSEGWKKMRGFDADGNIDDDQASWEARIHPDDLDRVREAVESHNSGRRDVISYEYRERRLDGRWVWISSRGRAVEWDDDGLPVRLTGTDTDITDRKQAEQAVEALSRRLELALDTSGVGVWEIDIERGTFTCDDALADIYGLPECANTALPFDVWKEILHRDDARNAISKAQQAIAAESRLEQTFRIVRADGLLRHIASTAVFHRDTEGKARFLGVDRDITEARKREDKLQSQNMLFESAIENMSHGLSMYDGDGRLIVANKLYADFYDFPDSLVVSGVQVSVLFDHMLQNGSMPETEIETAKRAVTDVNWLDRATENTWHMSSGRIIAFTSTPLQGGGWVSIHRDITEQRRAEGQLAESEQRFRDFTATASDWCWETDEQHQLTFVSQSFEACTGIPSADILGKPPFDIPVSGDDCRLKQSLFETPDGPNLTPFREVLLQIPGPDGGMLHLSASGVPRLDEKGRFLGFRGTGSDVTERETSKNELARAEAKLKARSEQLIEAQRIGRIGDWSYRLGDTHIWWSPETYALLGRDPATYETRHDVVMADYCGDGADEVMKSQAAVVRTGKTKSVDVKVRHGNGSTVDFAVVSKAVRDKDGALVGFQGTIQDISERKRAEEQLEKLAFYDPLTGLANRALFQRQLDTAIRANHRKPANGALLLLDLDRFKEVNDALGHESGDELLTKVADLLSGIVSERQMLARLGGDEFAIILPAARDRDAIEAFARDINTLLSGTVSLQRGDVSVETSIGIALIPADGDDASVLMRNADLALYQAKECGRGCFEFFRPELHDMVQNRLLLSRDLRKALEEEYGLFVHYQPQVKLDTGQVSGFEALLRWNHPQRGTIPPTEFIPIAEGSQLICDLGLWVLRQAAWQAKAWLEAGEPPRKMAVNVSAAQIWHSDFAAGVRDVLDETGLDPSLLCLELTESLLANHTEGQVRRVLEELRDLGVMLALDDFGTGYSSLGYLKQLPFGKLKIDRVFVSGITTSVRSRDLLQGIVALARGLNMTVVGEGAEHPDEVAMLKEMGCDIIQGFVYSAAVSAEHALAFAHDHERAVLADVQRAAGPGSKRRSIAAA